MNCGYGDLLGKLLDELWVWGMAELAGKVGVFDLKSEGDSLVPLMLGAGLVALQAETSTHLTLIYEYYDIDHFVNICVQTIHCNITLYLFIFRNSRM